jgi:simple sugar transport system substrate-binding protein
MNMKKTLWVLLIIALSVAIPMSVCAGGQQEAAEGQTGEAAAKEEKAEPFDVAVFVPGVVAGSPLYEQMANAAKSFAEAHERASVKVVEAGFNQGEWQEKLTSLAATGEYELILSSNPSMPFVAKEVTPDFPDQKFAIVDAYLEGNSQIYTRLYNQVEQAYTVGYLGGLVTTSNMEGANDTLKAGMVAAQEYPALTKMMKPGYEKGLKAVNENIELDYRVIGNWYDANKAADLANSMFDAGVDVVLSIAGGAGQGVIKAAKERGKYVLWFDSAEYDLAPGTIVGCGVLDQERSVKEVLTQAMNGELPYGEAEIVDMEAGYVDFADDDPLYKKHVPESVRNEMAPLLEKMRSGEISFQVPEL